MVKELYESYDEGQRLNTKASRIEFYTTIKEIERFLKPNMKILDLGAGTGEYSIYFAKKGYDLVALELLDSHVEEIKLKIEDDMKVEVYQGNALDLSSFQDESFDIVLSFGPLYHIKDEKDKLKSIEEMRRVSKDKGTLFFEFISNDMIILTETFCRSESFLEGDTYNHETFKLKDHPFIFHTVDRARELLEKANIEIISEIAVDGFSELLEDKINKMDDSTYDKYLKYHYYISKKPEFLGASNHLLFVGKK